MKKRKEEIFILILMLILISGCKKNLVTSDHQSILFHTDYINYAWGYQHYGYLIDNEGYIYTYHNPDEWNFQEEDLVLSEDLMLENLSKCTLSDQKIALDEINKYSAYIKNISLSKVTALKNVAADAGSKVFICYQYSETNGRYKGSLIKMEGDFSRENLNFYSKRVVAWMKDIDIIIAKN